jgi:glycosyltransferase involved in cell wall biosynthesis
MKISVILCTYNRCQSLPKALNSIAVQAIPNSVEWEVLVVDNNSSDQTRKVVEESRSQYPGRFRYVFEPHQGLSYARNAGIREARGDVLAFMDDDVTVDATWLRSLTACLHDGTRAGVGGRILPEQTFSPPPWLGLENPYCMGAPLFAHFDIGDEPLEIRFAPHGTNMAYRKEMFEKYGGFRTDMGRCGSNTMSNEDTEFGRRLLAAGERLWYEPSAVVQHPVPQGRLRKEYFLKWWFDFGRATLREDDIRRHLGGIPQLYLSMLKYGAVVLPFRVLRWSLAFDPKLRFYRKCRVWMTLGTIREFSSLAHANSRRGAAELPNQPPTGCEDE